MPSKNYQHQFDLLIAGAGPAGATLAIKMAGRGLRIGVIEKDAFPRNKICGDALSGKVINVLKRMPDGIYHDFLQHVEKIPSYGIRFTAPNHRSVDVPFSLNNRDQKTPPGYVCKRRDFDNFLYQHLVKYNDIQLITGEQVTHAASFSDHILLKTRTNDYTAKMLAGADGVHSVVRKDLFTQDVNKQHTCLGIRGYFTHVTGLHPDNFIELIFLNHLLPGYFWIFPTYNGEVNAGFGMMQTQASKQKESLISIFNDLIHHHPLLAPRFSNATLNGKMEAHPLPMGSYKFVRSAERSVILGDAAFLVDPFSGEGIGNAMASGEIAADVLLNCFERNDFSHQSLMAYDARIERRFGQEFRTTTIMQKLAHYPWLMNMVINKAIKNEDLRNLLSSMFTNEDIKEKLTRPGFYAGLILR